MNDHGGVAPLSVVGGTSYGSAVFRKNPFSQNTPFRKDTQGRVNP